MDSGPFLGPYRDIARLKARAGRILGVRPDAGPGAVREAFHRLARVHHPDHGGDPAVFARIVNAYLVLTRPDPRGFELGRDPDGPGVPGTGEEYLDWWKSRFFG